MTTNKDLVSDAEVEKARELLAEFARLMVWANELPAGVRSSQFVNMVQDDYSRTPIARAKQYAELVVARRFCGAPNLVITGKSGLGKTAIGWGTFFHILECMYAEGVRLFGPDQRYDSGWHLSQFKFPALHRAIWNARSEGGGVAMAKLPGLLPSYDRAESETACIEYLKNVHLLFLDEIALTKATPHSKEVLYLIIDGRAELGLPTIVTANKPLGLAAKLNRLDATVASRLMGNAVHIHLKGEDRRGSEPQRLLMSSEPALNFPEIVDPDPGRKVGYAKEEEERQQALRDEKRTRKLLLRKGIDKPRLDSAMAALQHLRRAYGVRLAIQELPHTGTALCYLLQHLRRMADVLSDVAQEAEDPDAIDVKSLIPRYALDPNAVFRQLCRIAKGASRADRAVLLSGHPTTGI